MTTASDVTSPVLSGTALKTQVRESASFRNFAIVWAFASLFHMAHSGVFDTRLNFALLTLAALYVIFKPSLSGFIALVIFQLFDVFYRMPNVTNHWLFTAFVNVTVLQSLAYLIWKKRSFNVEEADLYGTFAPMARVELIILYAWATFHKLNSAFFSPEVSCATELLRAQHLDSVIAMYPGMVSLNAYLTVLVEGGILLMLCFPRTRNAGVLLGFIFHLVISFSSYNAFFDFTSMVVAAYFLFTTPEFNARVDQWRKGIRPTIGSWFSSYSNFRLITFCIAVPLFFVALFIVNKVLDTPRLFHLYFFWTLYCAVLLFVLVRFLFVQNMRAQGSNMFTFSTRWFAIIPAIVFLNGASPYLGLKTENSFAMFSNLRTEGGVTNHYIAPAGLQIFDFQSNMVEIVSSSDPRLQRIADENQLVVLFEFRNYLQKYKPAELSYLLNGKAEVYRHGETKLTGALAPNSYLLSRLMKFRTISKNEPQVCAH